MKTYLAFILVSFLFLHSAKAQDSLTLKDLDLPNSPAFILLDQSPTTIERPKTGKAFALSVLNTVQENNGFPKNYGVEFTPFWFFKHKNMNSLKFLGYREDSKKEKHNIFANARLASISMAVINIKDSVTQKNINNASIGLRINILTIRNKEKNKNGRSQIIKIRDFWKDVNDEFSQKVDMNLLFTDSLKYKQQQQAFFENKRSAYEKMQESVTIFAAERPLFALDAALGYNEFFIENKYSDRHFGKFGAWLTGSVSHKINKSINNYLNVYMVGRYLSDGTLIENGSYSKHNCFDVGGKVELEYGKLALGYEYIYRIMKATDTFRSNASLKYKISENLFLTGAFGRNFGNSNNLISLLGINWGLSKVGTETVPSS